MNQPKPAAPARPKGKDRWGLRPVRAGRVRGQIRNVRRSFAVSDFGNILTFDFDLFVDDDVPLVPVRMAGADFLVEPQEGNLVDVRDPDPAVRPIETYRLDFPPRYEHRIIAYYPGRGEPPPWRERAGGLLVVIGPIGLAVALAGLFAALYW